MKGHTDEQIIWGDRLVGSATFVCWMETDETRFTGDVEHFIFGQ